MGYRKLVNGDGVERGRAATAGTEETGEVAALVAQLLGRLDRIEAKLDELAAQTVAKEWYTTAEAARLLGNSEWTVRDWCRLGRVRGEKKGSGRGKYQSWVISHTELIRIEREGLLPPKH